VVESISWQDRDGARWIALEGELDHEGCAEIRDRLREMRREILDVARPAAALDQAPVVERVERALAGATAPIKIAIMGCVVNGPGEAREADISPEERFLELLIHGILHLLGYDHDTPDRQAEMWALQSAAMDAARATRSA